MFNIAKSENSAEGGEVAKINIANTIEPLKRTLHKRADFIIIFLLFVVVVILLYSIYFLQIKSPTEDLLINMCASVITILFTIYGIELLRKRNVELKWSDA